MNQAQSTLLKFGMKERKGLGAYCWCALHHSHKEWVTVHLTMQQFLMISSFLIPSSGWCPGRIDETRRPFPLRCIKPRRCALSGASDSVIEILITQMERVILLANVSMWCKWILPKAWMTPFGSRQSCFSARSFLYMCGHHCPCHTFFIRHRLLLSQCARCHPHFLHWSVDAVFSLLVFLLLFLLSRRSVIRIVFE